MLVGSRAHDPSRCKRAHHYAGKPKPQSFEVGSGARAGQDSVICDLWRRDMVEESTLTPAPCWRACVQDADGPSSEFAEGVLTRPRPFMNERCYEMVRPTQSDLSRQVSSNHATFGAFSDGE
jgi:hypothetical protein